MKFALIAILFCLTTAVHASESDAGPRTWPSKIKILPETYDVDGRAFEHASAAVDYAFYLNEHQVSRRIELEACTTVTTERIEAIVDLLRGKIAEIALNELEGDLRCQATPPPDLSQATNQPATEGRHWRP